MLLSAHNITKRIGADVIIDDISLDVPAGKVAAVLGASGCGKTTLLRIISGLDSDHLGKVSFTAPRPGPKIAFLQQSERLLPWRTILDNVAVGLELIGVGRALARQKALEALKTVSLADAKDLFPASLSGGMTQRALLARSFTTDPELLLLDEPLGQLDIVGRRALSKIIKSYIQAKQCAALLVTHSIEEAVMTADIIFILSRKPARIIHRYILNKEFDMPGDYKVLAQENAFESILHSLLGALGEAQ